MGVFPKLGFIDESVLATIESRTRDNVDLSKLSAWIRISSAVSDGIIIESIPKEQNFASTYGLKGKSGAVGYTFKGDPIYAENDRIHRPSPVIESVSIQNGDRGLSRKASFSIKCFTLEQAEVLTQYFYEPGYVVLLEYGWNNDLSFQSRADLSENGACEIAKYNNYSYITEKRTTSKGMYDGFMGRITGGGYKNGEDDTYIIDVELTTLGEIPAYLQVHKGGISGEDTNTNSSLQYTINEIDQSTDDKKTGHALFQKMYNKLPNVKRSQQVKALLSSKEKQKISSEPSTTHDVNGNPWSDERNFINVDEIYRDEIMKSLESGFFSGDTQVTQTDLFGKEHKSDTTLPDGVTIISKHSYIRLELAFAILNAFAANLKREAPKNCSGVKTYSYIINTSDTVIGAHQWMFSTDGSKLFIPNTNHPEFGFATAFQLGSNQLNENAFINPKKINGDGQTLNVNPYKESSDEASNYAFPSIEPYKSPTQPPGILSASAPAHEWGYLRNLYINLDFFIGVLKRTNYVAKDIYYEILNGISSAAGSYWQFELIESPFIPENGNESDILYDNELSVQDLNFIGANDIKTESISRFFSKGINTPFLSSNLNMPIPAIMRNHILGKASSTKVTTLEEGVDENYTGIFSNELDPVTKILNSFNVGTVDIPTEETTTKTASREERLKANVELFLNKATVVPYKQTRPFKLSSDGKVLNKYLFVAAWDDSKILKQLELEYKSRGRNRDSKSVSAILSIDFSFEIHGVSGLKVGDLFQIIDIPAKFKDGVFQIMEQNHELSDGLWKTSVTAKLRNFTI